MGLIHVSAPFTQSPYRDHHLMPRSADYKPMVMLLIGLVGQSDGGSGQDSDDIVRWVILRSPSLSSSILPTFVKR